MLKTLPQGDAKDTPEQADLRRVIVIVVMIMETLPDILSRLSVALGIVQSITPPDGALDTVVE